MFSNKGLRAQGSRLFAAKVGRHRRVSVTIHQRGEGGYGRGRGAARDGGQQSHTRSGVLQYQEKSLKVPSGQIGSA
jgi:hypothetical protein